MGNLAREAAQIPTRITIVNTMSEFWKAGFWRLIGADPQWSLVTEPAGLQLTLGSDTLRAPADRTMIVGSTATIGAPTAMFFMLSRCLPM